MTRLYERRVKVVLNDHEFQGDHRVPGFRTQTIRGFRISFSVESSLEEHGNKCEVSIENLSSDSRGAVSARARPQLILDAGYVDTVGTLFRGEATHVVHERGATGFITKAIVASKLQARRGIVNASLGKGANLGQAIKKVAEAMGADAKKAIGQAVAGDFDGAKATFFNGLTMSGPAAQFMDTFARQGDFDWSIQNDELVIIKKGEYADQVAVVLGPTTGLVGSPQRVIDKKNIDRVIVGAKSLLQPTLAIGRKVLLESREISGTFKITRVKHSGDTHGAAWYSDVEMVATEFVRPAPTPQVQF